VGSEMKISSVEPHNFQVFYLDWCREFWPTELHREV